jgi:hypothetical protein
VLQDFSAWRLEIDRLTKAAKGAAGAFVVSAWHTEGRPPAGTDRRYLPRLPQMLQTDEGSPRHTGS